MNRWIWGYGAALAALTVLDGLWLGFVARDFYQRELAAVIAEPIRTLPALLFYLAYPLGVIALALHPMPSSLAAAIGRAALVGLLAYGTYDLTNLATLKSWSVPLTAVDMAWGTFITAMIGAAAYGAMQWRLGS